MFKILGLGLGFRVQDAGFRVSGFRMYCFRLQDVGLRFRAQGLRDCGFQDVGFAFRVQGLASRCRLCQAVLNSLCSTQASYLRYGSCTVRRY